MSKYLLKKVVSYTCSYCGCQRDPKQLLCPNCAAQEIVIRTHTVPPDVRQVFNRDDRQVAPQ
jgi:hypothetical protein